MNETNSTTLPIHISPHHLRLSPSLCEFAHMKLRKVLRFAPDALATDLVLRRHHGTAGGNRFSASARLAVAGPDIHATAADGDLYTAIVKLVARLTRHARKRKTRLEHATPRGPSRNPNRTRRHPATFDVAGPAPEHVQARDSRRRGGGQEQRVFGFRRSRPFAFHQM